MNPIASDILMHYGIKRRSGRYPWGSGENPYQHSDDFLSRVETLKRLGKTEKEIADEFDITTTELRVASSYAKHRRRQLEVDTAKGLLADGKSVSEIGRIMGKNESSIRSLLNETTSANKNQAEVTADILKKELAAKGMIDVGAGVERELGISETKMREALYILELEGYHVYGYGNPQVTNVGKQTNTAVLCLPDVEYKDVYAHPEDIKTISNYHSEDGGKTFKKLQYPASVDSNRVMINYAEDGGLEKDGVIELRRGVQDLDLGNSHYAQVRILVDGTHYLKGMAMYSDDLPDGVDIRFNTSKHNNKTKMEVLKPIENDPDNPFGALIKANGQSTYIGADGKEHLSAINKLKEEGDWDTMSKNLSSQFLSKQPPKLIKKQLDLTYADYAADFEEIKSLTNPTIKKKLLQDFADTCDSAVVHLKAAALPRQKTQVILPINDLSDKEIYAPTFRDGETVALVRYPHGGTFEIPILKVNNKNPKAKSLLGNVVDAVGINASVAERLSGADFDGDTVVVIPTNSKVSILSTPALEGLKDFNPKETYAYHDGMKLLSENNKQKQMGVVSNLITDMTLGGAPLSDITKAVKHSMVVIDATKHKLDYKQSEIDNDIQGLKQKWQKRTDEEGNEKFGGASTLLSRRKQDVRVPERKGSPKPDPETGKLIYKESGRTYVDKKTGEVKLAESKVKLLNEVDDLRKLSSGTIPENLYADYGNQMKALANEARKEAERTGNSVYSPSAKKTYASEVSTLLAKLDLALKNAPREREAQRQANYEVKIKVQDNPSIDKKEKKKIAQIAINNSRYSTGASGKETRIKITDKEWEAIQAGAVSNETIRKLLKYCDMDELKQRALPHSTGELSTAKTMKLEAMLKSGNYTYQEIADALGVSTSTVYNHSK